MTLANHVTLIRLGLALIAVFLAHSNSVRQSLDLAILLFLAAISMDKLDGYLARRNRSVSDLGKFLDITADRIVLAVFFLWLLDARVIGISWVTCALLRDMLTQGFRSYAASRGIFLRTYLLSKVRYILHVGAILAGLLSFSSWLGLEAVVTADRLRFSSQILFSVAVLLGYISLFVILQKNWAEVVGVGAEKK